MPRKAGPTADVAHQRKAHSRQERAMKLIEDAIAAGIPVEELERRRFQEALLLQNVGRRETTVYSRGGSSLPTVPPPQQRSDSFLSHRSW